MFRRSTPGDLVRVHEGYAGDGLDGGVYQYVGLGATLDLGAQNFNSLGWVLVDPGNLADGYLDQLGLLDYATNVTASDATAVGAVVVRNDVRGGAAALVRDATVQAADAVTVSALQNATIRALLDATVTADGGSVIDGGTTVAVNAALATNVVLSGATAAIDDSRVTSAGDVAVEARNTSTIEARTASNTTSHGISVGVNVAFNSVGWDSQNILFNLLDAIVGTPIGIQNQALTTATIGGSTIDAAGAMRVLAESSASIDAEVTTAVVAFQATADDDGATSVGVGATVAMNRLATRVQASIEDAAAVTAGADVELSSSDAARISAFVDSPVVTVGIGSKATSVGVGLSIARNEVDVDQQSFVRNAGAVTAGGAIAIAAAQTATIDATATAAAITFSIGVDGNAIAVSGGGATAVNRIGGRANAFAESTPLVAGGAISITTSFAAEIDAHVRAIVVAGGASTGTTPAVAIGFSIARNLIGWAEFGDAEALEVKAYATGAPLQAGGDVTISAASSASIEAFVAAASVAVAATTGSGGGGAAGGLWTDNKVATDVAAFVADAPLLDSGGGDLTISASDASSVVANAAAMAIAASLTGGSTGAVSIGVSLAYNTIENSVSAYLRDVASVTTGGGDVTISASDDTTIRALSVAVAISVAMSGDTGVSISGGGAAAANIIATTTRAFAERAPLGSAAAPVGAVTVVATSSAELEAFVGAVAAAVTFSGATGVGVALGAAVAVNIIGHRPGADVPFDHDSSQTVAGLAAGDRVRIVSAIGEGDVYEYVGEAVAGPVDLTIQDYRNGELWRLVNLADVASGVEAFVRDSSVAATGALSITAAATRSIDAVVVAAAVAISGGAGTQVGVSAAGVFVWNAIGSDVRAFVEGDGTGGITAASIDDRGVGLLRPAHARCARRRSPAPSAAARPASPSRSASRSRSTRSPATSRPSSALADDGIEATGPGGVAISAAQAGRPGGTLGGGLTAAQLDDAAQEDDDDPGTAIDEAATDSAGDAPIVAALSAQLGVGPILRVAILSPGHWQVIGEDGSRLITDDGGTLRTSEPTIEAIAAAAAISVAGAAKVGAGVSGAGAVATNVVLTKVNAFVESQRRDERGRRRADGIQRRRDHRDDRGAVGRRRRRRHRRRRRVGRRGSRGELHRLRAVRGPRAGRGARLHRRLERRRRRRADADGRLRAGDPRDRPGRVDRARHRRQGRRRRQRRRRPRRQPHRRPDAGVRRRCRLVDRGREHRAVGARRVAHRGDRGLRVGRRRVRRNGRRGVLDRRLAGAQHDLQRGDGVDRRRRRPAHDERRDRAARRRRRAHRRDLRGRLARRRDRRHRRRRGQRCGCRRDERHPHEGERVRRRQRDRQRRRRDADGRRQRPHPRARRRRVGRDRRRQGRRRRVARRGARAQPHRPRRGRLRRPVRRRRRTCVRSTVTAAGALTLTASGTRSIEAIVTAISMAIAAGGVGVGASGSGAVGENRILSDVRAFVDGGGSVVAASVTIAAADASGIRAIVGAASVAGAFGGVGVALSIGVSLAMNEVAGDIAAFVRASDVTATSGDVVVSASQAGLPGGGLGGSLTADDLDDLATQDADDPDTAVIDEAALDATGDAAILAALRAALGISGELRFVPIAAGRTWQVVTQDGSTLISDDGGTLVVSQATIDALSTAASLSAAIAGTAGVAVSGAGAVATNVVVTKVNAFVEDGDVDSAGDVALAASSDAAIFATVASLSVAIGGGTVGVGVSLGASLALNYIGFRDDGSSDPAEVRAYLLDASVAAGGDLALTATSAQTIGAIVVAASMAITGGSVGVSVSGSGVVADNRIAVHALAQILGTGATHVTAGAIAMSAGDRSLIAAIAGSASIAAAFGGVGVAVSIGVSLARNTIDNRVEASISGVSDLTATSGAIALAALEDARIDAIVAASSLAAAIGGVGVAISGAGAVATNVILTKTNAFVLGGAISSAGAVALSASDGARIRALVVAATAAIGGGSVGVGVSLGASLARNLIGQREDGSDDPSEAQAYISGASVSAAGALSLTASGTRAIQALVAALSAALTAGDVGVGASGSGAVGENRILTDVRAFVDGGGAVVAASVALAAADASGIRAVVGAVSVAAAFGGRRRGADDRRVAGDERGRGRHRGVRPRSRRDGDRPAT